MGDLHPVLTDCLHSNTEASKVYGVDVRLTARRPGACAQTKTGGPEAKRHQPSAMLHSDQLYWSCDLWADLAVADLSVSFSLALVLPCPEKV